MPYYDWDEKDSTDPHWQCDSTDPSIVTDLATGETIHEVLRCETESGLIVRLARNGKGLNYFDGDWVARIVEYRPFRISFPGRTPPESFETPEEKPSETVSNLIQEISGQVICGATVETDA